MIILYAEFIFNSKWYERKNIKFLMILTICQSDFETDVHCANARRLE